MNDYVSKLMVPVLEVNKTNKNRRYYPKELILKELKEWEGKEFPVLTQMPTMEELKAWNFKVPLEITAGSCVFDPEMPGNFLYAEIKIYKTPKGLLLEKMIFNEGVDFRTCGIVNISLRNPDNTILVTNLDMLAVAALPKGQGA